MDVSPPPTLKAPDSLKAGITRQRSAIASEQFNLSADARYDDSSLETPPATKAVKFALAEEEGATPAPRRSSRDVLRSIVLYENVFASLLLVISGAALLGAGHWALSGRHNITFLTATCYLLLLDLASNFCKSLISKSWQESAAWTGSPLARALADRAAGAVGAAAAAHDRFLSARDPAQALWAAAALWALALLGQYLSVWSVATLVFVLTFTVPATVNRYRSELRSAFGKASAGVKGRWAKLGLTRKQKAAMLLTTLATLWLRTVWPTRCAALLLGALAVRCHLDPAEVDAIVACAEPYTQSVRKRARRMSMAASDFANRALASKQHFR